MLAIQAQNLVKTYRTSKKRDGLLGGLRDLFDREYVDIRAVDDVSLEVKQGEFLGYIGPNGAGKSTSIKMLTGILQPTSGRIEVLGFNPMTDRREYSRKIGVVFGQRTQLWWDIAVKESFELLRRIYQVPKDDFKTRMKYLMNAFEIDDLLNIPVRKLSLGERMKCDIIASLIHDPKILFLDEPTIGLDAIAKNSIREILRSLHKDLGTTILLTTHDLREIEELCERIVVLDKGKIVYDGNVASIKDKVNLSRTIKLEFVEDIDAGKVDQYRNLKGVSRVSLDFKTLEIEFDTREISVLDIIATVGSAIKIRDIMIEEPSIEEVITKIYREGILSA